MTVFAIKSTHMENKNTGMSCVVYVITFSNLGGEWSNTFFLLTVSDWCIEAWCNILKKIFFTHLINFFALDVYICISACVCMCVCVCACACTWDRERKDNWDGFTVENYTILFVEIEIMCFVPATQKISGRNYWKFHYLDILCQRTWLIKKKITEQNMFSIGTWQMPESFMVNE